MFKTLIPDDSNWLSPSNLPSMMTFIRSGLIFLRKHFRTLNIIFSFECSRKQLMRNSTWLLPQIEMLHQVKHIAKKNPQNAERVLQGKQYKMLINTFSLFATHVTWKTFLSTHFSLSYTNSLSRYVKSQRTKNIERKKFSRMKLKSGITRPQTSLLSNS